LNAANIAYVYKMV